MENKKKKKHEHKEDCHCNEEHKCEETCKCEESCKCNEEECSCTEESNINDERELLSKRIKELEETLLRNQAELINYKKRKDEETSRIIKYAEEDILKGFLPILDNFERAINMDDDNLEDEVSKFLSGFKMIYCKFVSILEKNGVKAIDGGNKPFDPTYHQAVMTEKCDMEPGMVIEVLRKGYILKDKVIRPAMVKVSE